MSLDEFLQIAAAVLVLETFWIFMARFPWYVITAGIWGTGLCRLAQVAAILLMAFRMYGRAPAAVGLSIARWRGDLTAGLAAVLLLGGAAIGAREAVLQMKGIDLFTALGLRVRPFGGPISLWVVALVMGVVGPVAEDLFFWGICFPVARRRWNAVAASAVVVLPYALLHWQGGWQSLLPPAVGGTLFVALFAWRGSILATVPLHGAANLLMLLINRQVLFPPI